MVPVVVFHMLKYLYVAVRLLFEWVRCENSMLMSEAMKKKQQIWPGLCTLVNNLQQHLGSFNADKCKYRCSQVLLYFVCLSLCSAM